MQQFIRDFIKARLYAVEVNAKIAYVNVWQLGLCRRTSD